jgi:hypothetical protein
MFWLAMKAGMGSFRLYSLGKSKDRAWNSHEHHSETGCNSDKLMERVGFSTIYFS